MELVKAIEAAALAGIEKEREALLEEIDLMDNWPFGTPHMRTHGVFNDPCLGAITGETRYQIMLARAESLDRILVKANRLHYSKAIYFRMQ